MLCVCNNFADETCMTQVALTVQACVLVSAVHSLLGRLILSTIVVRGIVVV